MTTERTPAKKPSMGTVVWIDDHRAVIVEQLRGGKDGVQIIDRRPNETGPAFDARTVDRVLDQDQVVVAGPLDARTGFERAYVSVTHRPDRLVDVEPMAGTYRASGHTV
jgi:hypothetical protein